MGRRSTPCPINPHPISSGSLPASLSAQLSALSFAPASGEDTRRALTDAAADSGREYLERGRELYEMGRQLAEETAGLFDEGRKMMDSEA